jgi:hypothetical protein
VPSSSQRVACAWCVALGESGSILTAHLLPVGCPLPVIPPALIPREKVAVLGVQPYGIHYLGMLNRGTAGRWRSAVAVVSSELYAKAARVVATATTSPALCPTARIRATRWSTQGVFDFNPNIPLAPPEHL